MRGRNERSGSAPPAETMTVLVLRPRPEADETAARLRERGFTVVVSPLLAVAPGDPPPSGAFDAVAVTSPRALRALDALEPPMREVSLFVVGERCAALARDAGRAVASVADDARGLIAPLAAGATSVLHAAPEERAFDLEAALRDRGTACATWIAYRTVPRPLVPEAEAALRAGAAVLLSSPRIAGVFAAQWQGLAARRRDLDPLPPPRLLAISDAAARALGPELEGRAEIARKATLAGLLELL